MSVIYNLFREMYEPRAPKVVSDSDPTREQTMDEVFRSNYRKDMDRAAREKKLQSDSAELLLQKYGLH